MGIVTTLIVVVAIAWVVGVLVTIRHQPRSGDIVVPPMFASTGLFSRQRRCDRAGRFAAASARVVSTERCARRRGTDVPGRSDFHHGLFGPIGRIQTQAGLFD
jgi:hypothetical protein